MVISWEANVLGQLRQKEVSKVKKDIYVIKNDINDKVYVGQAINSKERFQSHCKPSAATLNNEYIGKAIQKYGKEHFWFEILESQIENYNEREKFWIKKFNCIAPNGYNLLEDGEAAPIMRGVEHPESVLGAKQVEELTRDLRETNLSLVVLAEKYGFKSNTSVSEFNKGLTYVRDIEYPIRKECTIGKLNSQDVEDIIQLLKYTYRSFESIGKQYGVEARAISRINKGVFHKQDSVDYPIRTWKATSNPLKLTYEQVTEIIFLLQTTSLSLREIGRQFGVEYRDILNIKNGTTKAYRCEGLTYPLRPNN